MVDSVNFRLFPEFKIIIGSGLAVGPGICSDVINLRHYCPRVTEKGVGLEMKLCHHLMFANFVEAVGEGGRGLDPKLTTQEQWLPTGGTEQNTKTHTLHQPFSPHS